MSLVSDVLAAEFTDRINASAGIEEADVEFVIEPDAVTLDEIQASLVEEGLLTDELAFRYAIVKDRVDELLRPGTYTLPAPITPASIAGRLALAPDPQTPMTVLDMRFGRRIEQIVAYLQQETENTDLELDPKEFLRLARAPTKAMRDEHRFLAQAPNGSSLEGFLQGGTYEVPVDITAEELILLMLGEWDRTTSKYVAEARKQRLSVSDVEVRQRILSLPAFMENGRFIGETR